MRLINQEIGIDFFLLEMALTVEQVVGDLDNPVSADRDVSYIPIAAVTDRASAAFATTEYLLTQHPTVDFKIDSDEVLFPIPPGHTTRSIVKIVDDELKRKHYSENHTMLEMQGRMFLALPLLDHIVKEDRDYSTVYFSVGIRITRLPMY